MAGYVILRYNEGYKTWDVVLYDMDEEIETWEVDCVAVDKRYLNKIEVFEPHGDA